MEEEIFFNGKNFSLIHMDSLKWLKNVKKNSVKNIVTGIPDYDEVQKFIPKIEDYKKWFSNIAKLIFEAVNINGYCIFHQTDRKIGKKITKNNKCELLSKAELIISEAKKLDIRLLWHKICVYDKKNIAGRIGYSHILCFSKNSIGDDYNLFPDVISAGTKLYNNSTPSETCKLMINFIKKYKKYNKKYENSDILEYDIVDPFVGQGSIIYFANKYKLTALGIDIAKYQLNQTIKNMEELS